MTTSPYNTMPLGAIGAGTMTHRSVVFQSEQRHNAHNELRIFAFEERHAAQDISIEIENQFRSQRQRELCMQWNLESPVAVWSGPLIMEVSSTTICRERMCWKNTRTRSARCVGTLRFFKKSSMAYTERISDKNALIVSTMVLFVIRVLALLREDIMDDIEPMK